MEGSEWEVKEKVCEERRMFRGEDRMRGRKEEGKQERRKKWRKKERKEERYWRRERKKRGREERQDRVCFDWLNNAVVSASFHAKCIIPHHRWSTSMTQSSQRPEQAIIHIYIIPRGWCHVLTVTVYSLSDRCPFWQKFDIFQGLRNYTLIWKKTIKEDWYMIFLFGWKENRNEFLIWNTMLVSLGTHPIYGQLVEFWWELEYIRTCQL